MTHTRRIGALSALALTLVLGACSTPEDLTPPTLERSSDALITDADLDGASLQVAATEIEVEGIEAGSVPDGAEVNSSADAQLSSQAVLPGATGYITYIRVIEGTTKTWQLWLSNQSTDSSTLVYQGNRTINSTTVNLAGNTLFFTAQVTAGSSNYDVYRLTLSNNAVTRLTTTTTSEADVSVSANGQTVVWGGVNPSGGKRAIFLRFYSSSTSFTQRTLGISSGNQYEPTISGDGAYIAFIRQTTSTQVMRFRKSDSTYLTVSTPSTGVYVRAPSVSNGGSKVAWGENAKQGSTSTVKVKTLSSGSTSTVVSISGLIQQPQLTSDGAYVTYAAFYNSAINVFTKNLSNGQTARLTSDGSPTVNTGMFWQKDATVSPVTVTIQGTVSIGSGTSSSASASRVEGYTSGSKSEPGITAQRAPDVEAPRSLRQLRAAAQRAGTVSVIVDLDVPFTPEGELSAAEAREQRKAIADAQKALLQDLPRNSVKKTKTLKTVPVLALTVDAEGLEALTSSGIVEDVQDDAKLYPSLAESVSLIGGDVAWDAGYDGSGWTVAVLDTGVDTAHPFLSAHIVDEACFVSNYTCPNGTNEQTGRGSSVPASNESHGSHVAGIAAGLGSSFSGVARGANIMAVDIFATYDGSLVTYYSDVIRGLEYVYLRQSALRIASVNMSLGGGAYSSACDYASYAMKAAVDNLRSVNIATIVSSGNSSYTDALGFPACISSAISVGATGDGSSGATLDQVVNFSNSASFLDFLAPGQWINSSVPGGGYEIYQGTSMAAPHVAGAWAVLKQRFPSSSVDDIYSRFQSNGVSVTDTRNGVTKPRIDVYRALGSPTLPPPPIRVKLFNAATGALAQEVAADSSGRYSFSNVPAGRYYVAAYGDKSNDRTQGSAEPAGAFGSAAIPQQIDAVSGTYTANILIATPTEVEPNNDRTTNNTLLSSTYINGYIEGSSYYDHFKLLVPAAGSYTLSTLNGCKFDTVLDLYSASGSTLATNDDSGGVCSLVTYDFTQAGTYFVRVRSYGSTGGDYTLTFQR